MVSQYAVAGALAGFVAILIALLWYGKIKSPEYAIGGKAGAGLQWNIGGLYQTWKGGGIQVNFPSLSSTGQLGLLIGNPDLARISLA